MFQPHKLYRDWMAHLLGTYLQGCDKQPYKELKQFLQLIDIEGKPNTYI
jgi:hypothetical protein